MRVLVVAASEVVRAGLESVLAGRGLAVVRAPDPREPIADQVESLEPDVVVLEADPPLPPPLPLTLGADAAPRAPGVVLLVEDPDAAAIAEALRNGAGAVLSLTATGEEIAAAVEAVGAGLLALPRDLAARVVDSLPRTEPREPGEEAELTRREAEVLAMLAEGHGNKRIARRLGISEHTVKAHLAAIFAKLGASTRTEAVAIGARRGLMLL